MFRIQPMRNGTALGGDIAGDGVGRQARTYPPGTNSTTVANPVATPPPPLPPGVTLNAAGDQVTFTPQGGQDLVANGVAFNKAGDLFVLDTARGAIWKATFDSKGNLKSETGCDTTFTANTLCLDNVYVAHPLLEGADGFVSDLAGNFWVDANERNAVVVVTPLRQVVEIFRSPPDPTTNLRNTGPLEFPTSPFISGKIFCTSNSDGNRRDNSPNSAGEINSGGPVGARGKISCMEEELKIPGLPLPIGSGKSKW
jgi:sugar lactone lactonase YvrE